MSLLEDRLQRMDPEKRSWNPVTTDNNSFMSLEEQLYTSLKTTSQDITFDKLCEVITEVALQQWNDLFPQMEYEGSRGSNFWPPMQSVLRPGLRMLQKRMSDLDDLHDKARVEAQIKEWNALVKTADLKNIFFLQEQQIYAIQRLTNLQERQISAIETLQEVGLHSSQSDESLSD